MNYAPHMLGAVALVAIGGALSGAAIGDTRILERNHADTLPEARIVKAGNEALRNGERPPDHYPLETPQGTIEVAELALHGRMRDSAAGMWWEDEREEAARLSSPRYDFYAEADADRLAREEALLAFTGSSAEYQARRETPQRMTRAEAPMALAEPAERPVQQAEPETAPSPREPSTGNAKTIDVTAALAKRD